MSIYDKLFPPKTITLANGKTVQKKRTRMPLVILILAALTALSVKVTGFNMHTLVSRINEFFVILGQMFSAPNWSYMPKVWGPLFDTIQMSLLGSVAGAILVVPFAMLASTNVIKNNVVVTRCV